MQNKGFLNADEWLSLPAKDRNFQTLVADIKQHLPKDTEIKSPKGLANIVRKNAWCFGCRDTTGEPFCVVPF